MSNEEESDKQKIQELQNRIDFLTNILDTLPFNVFAKDTECRYIYNNKFSDIMNHSKPGELIGKSDYDLWPQKEIAEKYIEIDKMQINNGYSYRDYLATLEQNEVTYLEIFKEPLYNKNKNIMGLVGVVISPPMDNRTKDKTKSFLEDTSPSIIFDYYYLNNRLEILKNIEGFNIFKDNRINIDYIHPNDVHILDELEEEIQTQPINIVHLIRVYNLKRELALCHLEIHLTYDKNMKPTRFSGLIRPINQSNKRDEVIDVELINAKKGIFSKIRDSYDLCLYVNPEYNYYYVYYDGDKNGRIPQFGEWTEFQKLFFSYIHENDIPIFKTFFHSLKDILKINSHKRKEFRIREKDGTYRWKSFDIQILKNSYNDSLLLFFYDIDESVREREQRTIKEINNELVDTLSTIVEFRDVESGEHITRIKTITRILLKTANKFFDNVEYSNELIDIISSASALHDIGKIAISDSILLKPGRLTPEEFEIMKTHSIKGCEILKSIPTIQDASYFKYSYDICRHHHERYDGKGYPDGLKGDEISLEAQIVSLADVFDALTSERCYKKAFTFDEAVKMILNGECGAFSEKMLKCFHEALPELRKFLIK